MIEWNDVKEKPTTSNGVSELLIVMPLIGEEQYCLYFKKQDKFVTRINGECYYVKAKQWRIATEKEIIIYKMQDTLENGGVYINKPTEE